MDKVGEVQRDCAGVSRSLSSVVFVLFMGKDPSDGEVIKLTAKKMWTMFKVVRNDSFERMSLFCFH